MVVGSTSAKALGEAKPEGDGLRLGRRNAVKAL